MEKDYRELYERITNSEWFNKAYQDKSLGECPIVVEELEESEDERIRKGLIEALKTSKTVGELKFILPEPTREECIAYLEKQKEASKAIEAVDRIDKYIDEHLANAHDMKDSNPDKKYYRGWDDALGKMAGILQDVYSEKENKFAPRVLPSSAAWFEDGDEKQEPAEDWREQRKKECPFRRKLDNNLYGCERYADVFCTCDGNCSWVVDYPKLKEIQDRKEQKEIVQWPNLSNCKHDCKTCFAKCIYRKEQNEEQKPINESNMHEPTLDEARKWNEAYEKGYSLGYENGRNEQKPAWSEEDEHKRTDAIYFLETTKIHYADTSEIEKTIGWLKSLPERFNLQPKHEWGEEDETHRAFILESLEDQIRFCKKDAEGAYYTKQIRTAQNWLKSLPKEWKPIEEVIKKIRSEEYTKGFNDAAFGGKLKEWSVEDEDRIRQIERIAQEAGCTQKLQEEIHDWLKSLRPHWKPSKEQMDALYNVEFKNVEKFGPILNSLYNDLKKL